MTRMVAGWTTQHYISLFQYSEEVAKNHCMDVLRGELNSRDLVHVGALPTPPSKPYPGRKEHLEIHPLHQHGIWDRAGVKLFWEEHCFKPLWEGNLIGIYPREKLIQFPDMFLDPVEEYLVEWLSSALPPSHYESVIASAITAAEGLRAVFA